ncbi:MAG: proton-conducting transporter membrane subunit [candidate division WOR-3 bacterium]|nr:proton-conducting transporter membrane subunit [candidate division WOR-3 bacterium]
MINTLYFYSMIVSIILIYMIGDISRILRNILAVSVYLYSLINLVFLYNTSSMVIPVIHSMDLNIAFTFSSAGYFFMILNHIAFGFILFNALHNISKRDSGYILLIFLIFYSVNLLFFSANLFTFFILWEFISVMIFFAVSVTSAGEGTGLMYIAMNAGGSLLMLLAIAMLYSYTGTVNIDKLSLMHKTLSPDRARIIIILFSSAMLIKSGFIGLHVWVNDAYVKAKTVFTGYLSSMLSKLGIFGMILLFFKIFPYSYVNELFTFSNIQFFRIFFTLGGSLTALIGTIIAVKETDIKKTLIYSSVAQMGYIIASFGLGYEWALVSIFVLMTVHTLIKTSLFSDLAFIEYKTDTTDARSLGGLIKVIPFTFISSLISIIALAGIVPLMGFAGKWVYYQNMFVSGHYLALAISFLASTIAFLYCYKILSTVFLGILSPDNADRNYFDSPSDIIITVINMIIPLSLVVLGIYPYPFFKLVFKTVNEFIPSVNMLMNGNFLESTAGYWNPLWIGSAVIALFILLLIFFIAVFRKSRRVSQYDIAMSAEVVKPRMPLHYASNFYDGFIEVVKPVVSARSEHFYRALYSVLIDTGSILKRFHLNTLSSNNMIILAAIIIIIITIWGIV